MDSHQLSSTIHISNDESDDDVVMLAGGGDAPPASSTNDSIIEKLGVAVKDKKFFPGPATIGNAYNNKIRDILFIQVQLLKLHTVVNQKERKKHWLQFYNRCFAPDGVLYKNFKPYNNNSPEKKFRHVVFRGIEVDAQRYTDKIEAGEKEETVPEIERRAHFLQQEMLAAKSIDEEAKTKAKEKVARSQSSNELAKVRMGLRTSVTPSPKTGDGSGNPASLLGNKPTGGVSC